MSLGVNGCVNLCVWVSAMTWNPIQGVFQLFTQCSWDRLWICHKDKVVTKMHERQMRLWSSIQCHVVKTENLTRTLIFSSPQLLKHLFKLDGVRGLMGGL